MKLTACRHTPTGFRENGLKKAWGTDGLRGRHYDRLEKMFKRAGNRGEIATLFKAFLCLFHFHRVASFFRFESEHHADYLVLSFPIK